MVVAGNPYPKITVDPVYEWSMMAAGGSLEDFVKLNLRWMHDAIPNCIDTLDRAGQNLVLGVMPAIAHARSRDMSLWTVYVPFLGVHPMEVQEGERQSCHVAITLKRYIMAASSEIHPRIAERGIRSEITHLLMANSRFSRNAPMFCYGPFTDYREMK